MSEHAPVRRWREAFRPSPAWLLVTGLLLTHQLVQRALGINVPFLDSYLDPVLSVPVLVGLAAAERRWLLGATCAGFGWPEVAGMTLGIAVIGEFVFPWLDPVQQVYDPWDFVAYGVGCVITVGWMHYR